MKKVIMLFLLLLISISWSIAQKSKTSREAIVGQPCPDLYFQKTINFNKPTLYLHELRGKWVILDLWSMHCGACIASFPHISEKQAKFKDKVQFLMGTYDDPEGKNAAIYMRFNKMLHLQMPCVFNGTSETKPTDLFKQFKVGGLPFVVIIDPQGIVRVVTLTVNEEQIQSLLNGERPKFYDAQYSDDRNKMGKAQYNTSIPFLANGNGGAGSRDEFEYRAIIAKWTSKINNTDYSLNFTSQRNLQANQTGRLEWLGASLSQLYRLAYFGRITPEQFNQDTNDSSEFVWQEPILELKDTSQFVWHELTDDPTGKNLFCYSLIVPAADGTKENMLNMMQGDLKRYFKYDATLETRPMPCWKLIVTDSTLVQQIKTKGGKYEDSEPTPRVSLKEVNVPMKIFAKQIKFHAGLYDKPFIDETSIDYNIDAYLEYVPDHIESVNKALEKYGLKIVKSEQAMKVLVIRDPVPVQAQIAN